MFSRGEVSLPVHLSDDEIAPPMRMPIKSAGLNWARTGCAGVGGLVDTSVVRFACPALALFAQNIYTGTLKAREI